VAVLDKATSTKEDVSKNSFCGSVTDQTIPSMFSEEKNPNQI
jgi:hypothetical protein